MINPEQRRDRLAFALETRDWFSFVRVSQEYPTHAACLTEARPIYDQLPSAIRDWWQMTAAMLLVARVHAEQELGPDYMPHLLVTT
jgi:hypothetical protein